MRIDAAIAAMQRDPGLQRRAQAEMFEIGTAWRADPAVAPLLVDLEKYGAGAGLDECPALEAAFAASAAAGALARSMCRLFLVALERIPLGHLPFRSGFDHPVSSLLLARSGRAQLVLHGREPGRHDFEAVSFCDASRCEAVLAGSARGRLVRRRDGPAAEFSEEPVEIRAGARLRLDLSREDLLIERVERRLVTLRLQRTAALPEPTCEYRLSDGEPLHRAAGDLSFSRQEMMLALLGRMGRTEAVPAMAAIAGEPGDMSLRWQALRECLALDSTQGFRALSAVARAAGDPLAGPAGALRAQLLEAHPQLLQLEDDRCPA